MRGADYGLFWFWNMRPNGRKNGLNKNLSLRFHRGRDLTLAHVCGKWTHLVALLRELPVRHFMRPFQKEKS
jgi:hypothetical protein